jgi:hypothetical protein
LAAGVILASISGGIWNRLGLCWAVMYQFGPKPPIQINTSFRNQTVNGYHFLFPRLRNW